MTRSTLDLVVGIAMIVFGILMVLGKFGLGSLAGPVGIALIVLAILIFIRILPGGILIGVVCLVVGILLLGNFLSLPKGMGEIMWIINLVLGIILIVFGVKRIM